MIKNVISLSVLVVMLAIGQVLFKRIGLSVHGATPMKALHVVIVQPVFYAALMLYGVSTLLWIWILARVPLSQAYPWVAAGVLIVPLLGWWVFGERPMPVFWFGVLLIISGLAITQYGSGSP